jgi:uncharacterized protein with HEPN domain
MILEPAILLRLQFLSRVIRKECKHLLITDSRLFRESFTLKQAMQLDTDPDLAERVEAFVSRFARLQDTLGDKLLPQLLRALGEKTASALDNLNVAERLGFVDSVDDWMMMRNLRNQMIHEYIEDLAVLVNALQTGHTYVPNLITTANNMLADIEQRGWI